MSHNTSCTKILCERLAMSHNWYVAWSIKKNAYQGKTPLMLAAGSALSDCVKALTERNADLTLLDRSQRGCLQLARQSQGKNESLGTWLRDNNETVPDSWGKGRAKEDQRRGQFSQSFRKASGPAHYKGKSGGGKGMGKAKGKTAMTHNWTEAHAQRKGQSKRTTAMSHDDGPQPKRQCTYGRPWVGTY